MTVKEIKNENKFLKLMLFMLIRNTAVLPIGIKLGKDPKEINRMSYETMQVFIMNEIEDGVPGFDLEKCQRDYDEGKKLYLEQRKESQA